MINFQIEKYQAEHAVFILSQGHTRSIEDPRQCEIMEKSKFSVTLMADDEPILCSGIIDLWPGVGEGWFISTDQLSEHPVTLARATKEVLHHEIDDRGYWRVQVNVRSDWGTAIRFAKFLGFKNEGLMKKFGPDKVDYVRMSIVRN